MLLDWRSNSDHRTLQCDMRLLIDKNAVRKKSGLIAGNARVAELTPSFSQPNVPQIAAECAANDVCYDWVCKR